MLTACDASVLMNLGAILLMARLSEIIACQTR